MSLSEYNLWLAREPERGDVLPGIEARGLVRSTGQEQSVTSLGIPCYVDEWSQPGTDGPPVRALRLTLEPDTVEEHLRAGASAFVEWVWEVLVAGDAAYAFMGEGGYSGYFRTGGMTIYDVMGQLGRLVAEGEVRYVHPLMYFAERLRGGSLCDMAVDAPGYTATRRSGAGCLLLLVDVDPASGEVDIMDPGIMYPHLRRHFLAT